jgi:hypothetical protein
MATFADAFSIDWQELTDAARDPEVIGLGLIPPATCLVVRPFPVPAESRTIKPETLASISETLDQTWPLPIGFTRRNEPVNGLPLRVLVLRRALGSGYALGRMVEHDFLTDDAALILRAAAHAANNIVIAGPSRSPNPSR